jgi:hypothetical protein
MRSMATDGQVENHSATDIFQLDAGCAAGLPTPAARRAPIFRRLYAAEVAFEARGSKVYPNPRTE